MAPLKVVPIAITINAGFFGFRAFAKATVSILPIRSVGMSFISRFWRSPSFLME